MKYKFSILYLLIFLISISQEHTISGYIKDRNTGEVLIGASVFIESESKGTSTNVYGFYSIKLSSGNHDVKFSYIGFNDFVKTIQLDDHKKS